jgi:hypothetical protein
MRGPDADGQVRFGRAWTPTAFEDRIARNDWRIIRLLAYLLGILLLSVLFAPTLGSFYYLYINILM